MYDCDINFGKTYLFHDNKIVAFVMHQFVYFGLLMIENAVFFVGDYMFSNIMGPIMDEALNHYRVNISLASPFTGQAAKATFELDYRNTNSPYIGDGFIDLSLLGELLYKPQKDTMHSGMHGSTPYECVLDPDYLSFTNSETFSQFVISESAATCMMNSFASSKIGQL